MLFTYSTASTSISENVIDYVSDSDSYVDDVEIYIPSSINSIQYSFEYVFENLLSVEVTKLDSIKFYCWMQANTTTSQTISKVLFRAFFIQASKTKINSVLLNKTNSISFKASAITTTRDIEKIADTVIPIKKQLAPKKIPNSDTLEIEYDYEFSIPDDSALSFSNVVVNMTLPDYEKFSVNNVTEFYVDLEDKLDTLQNIKPGDTITVMQNPTPGNLHQIQITIKYSEDIYDKLITEKVTFVWYDPDTWTVAFWGFVAAVLSLVGIGVGWAKAKQREAATKAFTKK